MGSSRRSRLTTSELKALGHSSLTRTGTEPVGGLTPAPPATTAPRSSKCHPLLQGHEYIFGLILLLALSAQVMCQHFLRRRSTTVRSLVPTMHPTPLPRRHEPS